MEFRQTLLRCANDSVEDDIAFVKQELAEDNITVHDNHDTSTNEECMEFIEEKPIISEFIENSTNVGINQENSEDFAGTHQDFVFVACVDNVDLNDIKLEDPIANTNAGDSSVPESVPAKKQCPYCGKKYAFCMMDTHRSVCDWKYLYPCAFCPTILYHKNNIKRHIQAKHSLQLKGSNVDEIFEDIVAKRVELNIETAAEKIKAVSEMMTNASLRAEIIVRPVAPDSSSQFIVPDIDIQETRQETSTSLSAIKAGSNATAGSSARQKPNVPFVVIHPTTNKQSQSVTTKKATPMLKYLDCNECAYQTLTKEDLGVHIRMKHSVQLNLISHECRKCEKNFATLNQLTAHKTNCNVKTSYSCLFCPKYMFVKARIVAHIQDQHAKEVASKKLIEIVALVEATKRLVDFSTRKYDDGLTRTIRQAKMQKLNNSSGSDVIVVHSGAPQKKILTNCQTTRNLEYIDCDECAYKTRSKEDVGVHIRSKHSAQLNLISHQCPKCEKNFADLDQLTAHKANCNFKTLYSCLFCPKGLLIKGKIVAHIRDQHAKEVANKTLIDIVTLVEAKKKLIDFSAANQEEQLTSAIRYSLIKSLKKTGSDVVVDSDARRKKKVISFKAIPDPRYMNCNECAYQTLNKEDLVAHIRIDHSVQLNLISFECPKCQKSFASLNPFVAHKANCHSKTLYSCLFCPKILLVKGNILWHIRCQHPDRIANINPIEMDGLIEAKKRVVDLLNANPEEQVTHPTIRRAVRRSLKDSSDSDVVVVDSDAQQKSNSSSVEIVSNKKRKIDKQNQPVVAKKERPKLSYLFCDKCIFKTTDKDLLQQHIVNNQCDKLDLLERKCRNCEKTFACRDDWKTHEASCSVRTYFSCPFCAKIFLRKVNMEKHLSQTHPKEVEHRKREEIESLIEARKNTVDTSIIDTQTKATKPKSQYHSCEHCRFKTRQKDTLTGHVVKKHSAKLNLKKNPEDRYNYKCAFCKNVYVRMEKAKLHISQKHSSELSNRTIDEIAEEMFSKRTKVGAEKASPKIDTVSFVDPDKIDASTLDYVLVYCDKCKNLKTTSGTLQTRKNNCRDCGARIIYVCSKCKNSHTLDYMHFRKHWNRCTEINEISQDYLDKLVVHKCPQCQFCTTHKYKLAMHTARSKHKAADGKSVEEDKNEETVKYLEVYDEDKFAIRPCVVDFATMTNRFCPKCDKIVTEEMQPRKATSYNQVCQVCETRFHGQCVKCNIRKPTWLSMRYHLNTKCFPGEYLCIKCPHRTPSWQLMQKHYVIHHTDRPVPYLCEFCSFRSTHRTNFNFHLKKMHPDKTEHIVFTREYFVPQKNIDYACDLCSFKSKHKYSLKVHLHTVHSTKKHKCKLCKFKTRYDANLKRHVLTRHQNFY